MLGRPSGALACHFFSIPVVKWLESGERDVVPEKYAGEKVKSKYLLSKVTMT